MNVTMDLLSQFQADITEVARLPYLQIVNPPNMSLAQIKQFNPPFGWFIPTEQAELAGFMADQNFEPITITFGEDTPQATTTYGFLAKKVRVCILHK